MKISTERTTFTKDILGRFTLNTWQDVTDSFDPTNRPDARKFDIVIVGAGSFGSVVAQHLFANDLKHSHRILVLEAGPLALPEHVQNLPLVGYNIPGPTETDPGDLRGEVWGFPWRTNVPKGFTGLAYCMGGRSVFFGGWSPQLLESETAAWPQAVLDDLRNPHPGGSSSYFRQASEQIGTNESNDFMYGVLHEALRNQLFEALQTNPSILPEAIPLEELPLHLDVEDDIPPEMHQLLKLEAPLAVQGRPPRAGFFPFNKFSAAPLLMQATRSAEVEASGDDYKKRLMIVPDARVVELITGDRIGQKQVIKLLIRLVREGDREVTYDLPDNGLVIIANSTIESTRLALESFQVLPVWQEMGKNLIAHLRSNLTIRVPKDAIKDLPEGVDLESSALFLKCRHDFGDGTFGHYHFQITASGHRKPSNDSEAQLFKKIPDIDNIIRFEDIDESHVVITIRGIGEMAPNNPKSKVTLLENEKDEFNKRRAFVEIEPSERDALLWDAMDDTSNQVAAVFAHGMAYQVLTPNGLAKVLPSDDLKQILPYTMGEFGSRRDGLGTTHHEAGSLRMGDENTPSVTDPDCRIKGVANAYVAGPALFPSVGSPNPMLTGVALARRLADKLIPPPELYAGEPGFTTLFDGVNLANWQMSQIRGPEKGYPGNFALVDGVLEAMPGDDIGLFWCTIPTPPNFILKLEWRRLREDDNSGVFVRFPHSDSKQYKRTAYVGVNFGFEIQIDQQDSDPKRRTGAIYNFKAPSNPNNIPVKPPGLTEWNLYEIRVEQQTYTVILNGQEVNKFEFTAGSDAQYPDRALPSTPDLPRFLGLQTHGGNSRVGFRHIRIKEIS
ncbi:MAG: family 16 glycoside hydrolase [Candidatus Entotheonellia bacterium]